MRAKYVGPTARQIAYSLHGTHSWASNGWWSLRGLCHGRDSTPPTGGEASQKWWVEVEGVSR